NRETGFLDTMKSKFPGIRIVSDDQYGGPTSATSQKVAENLLTRFAKVGIDSSEKLVQALRKDEIHGLVVQNPYKMGFDGVRAILQHLKKQPVEKRVDTGVAMATRENMDEPEVRKLL